MKQDLTPIETAEQILADATADHRKALARLREHDDLTEKTEAALADLSGRVAEGLQAKDGGAQWRKTRAALVGELDGLRFQRGTLEQSVKDAETGIRAAERTLEAARMDDLTVRLAAAEKGLEPHVRAIAEAWKLYCLRYIGHVTDDRFRLANWLFNGELFDLEALLNIESPKPY